jgi:hypothetical protein
VAQLERRVGQQALEIDFLKACLQRIKEQRKLQALLRFANYWTGSML